MLNLADWGLYEQAGVLVQPFQNGKAMQVRLAEDNIDVFMRQVPVEFARDTARVQPEWSTAYDLIMSEWVRSNSPVWRGCVYFTTTVQWPGGCSRS